MPGFSDPSIGTAGRGERNGGKNREVEYEDVLETGLGSLRVDD